MSNNKEWRQLVPVSRLIIFPGDIPAYERGTRYPVDIIETDSVQKGVMVIEDSEIRTRIRGIIGKEKGDYLVREGIEAIVHATIIENVNQYIDLPAGLDKGMIGYYGLPVRRRK